MKADANATPSRSALRTSLATRVDGASAPPRPPTAWAQTVPSNRQRLTFEASTSYKDRDEQTQPPSRQRLTFEAHTLYRDEQSSEATTEESSSFIGEADANAQASTRSTLRSSSSRKIVTKNPFGHNSAQDEFDLVVNEAVVEWGKSRWLLLEALGNLVSLIVPLWFIMYQNYQACDRNDGDDRCGNESEIILMRCYEYNGFTKYFCEYTRFYVVSFPYIAGFFVLYLIGWRLLRQRSFYGVMQVHAIIDYHHGSLFKRKALRVVVVWILHVLAHFALHVAVTRKFSIGALISKSDDAVRKNFKEIQNITFSSCSYLAPMVVFLIFVRNVYFFKERLLPLSIFIDSDPLAASNALARTWFLPEDLVAYIMQYGSFLDDNSSPCEAPDLFRKLIRRCRDYRGGLERPFMLGEGFSPGMKSIYGSEIKSPRTTSGKYKKNKKNCWQKMQGLLKFLSLTWWPERLVLATNLIDPSTRAFRRAWLTYLCVSLFFMSVHTRFMYNDIEKALKEDRSRGSFYCLWIVAIFAGCFHGAAIVCHILQIIRHTAVAQRCCTVLPKQATETELSESNRLS